MRSSYKRIGDYIQLVDERNRDLSIATLLGLSIDKIFIPSVANTVGSNMANYKIIRKGQFACSLMQVRRDKKIPVAMLNDYEEAIISQAYPVFEIKNTDDLLPQYLMMWMSRSEFDREACFYAVGGVRGSLEWEDFCNMELPVPTIEKQMEIVREYYTIVDRIKLNEQLNQKLEETAQAIYKQWFVDFEFPMSKEHATEIGKPELEGKPYKSSGGKMVWNDELDQEIPEGWAVKTVKDFCKDMKSGGTPSRTNMEYWDSNDIPWLKTGEIKNNIIIETSEFISKKGLAGSSAKLLPKGTVLMSMYGVNAGDIGILKTESTTNQACCGMICNNPHDAAFLYYQLLANQEFHRSQSIGGAQENLSKDYIEKITFLIPSSSYINNSRLEKFVNARETHTREIKLLNDTLGLLLSKMTKAEATA